MEKMPRRQFKSQKIDFQKKLVPQELISRQPEIAHESRASYKHPERNEDSYFVHTSGVLAVFDGVGGLRSGNTASSIGKDSFEKVLTNPQLENTQNSVETAMIIGWNNAISKLQEKENENPKIYQGMSTTCTVAKVYTDLDTNKLQLTYLQSGDSRLYVRKTDGSIRQITQDDSLWTKLSDKDMLKKIEKVLEETNGYNDPELKQIFNECYDISEEFRHAYDTYPHTSNLEKNLADFSTIEEKEVYKFFDISISRIQKALYASAPSPDSYVLKTVQLEKDDQDVLITSDGGHDNLKKSEIEETGKNSSSIKEFIENIVEKAEQRSKGEIPNDPAYERGKIDDITAVGFRFRFTN